LAYISLYRKWRPQTFEEIIGQEYVTRTLENSLRSGNYSHAYLFAGPRGTGKTSTARILAKALNCEEGPTPHPCNRCSSCREITEGFSVDIIEIDAASNRGIDDVRDLRERVIYSPAAARTKVYILDEAHMLTPPAFNALLKMLEEPPAHVVFVLATTEPHRMPPTILSRCQRFDFRSVPALKLVAHLAHICGEEGIEASESALRLIARRARGSVRDALVVLEQVISYGDGVVDESEVAGFLGLVEDELLLELGERVASEDAAGVIALVEKAYEEGRDLIQFAREAQEHFRRIFLLKHADLSPEELELEEGVYRSLRQQAEGISPARAHYFVTALREAIREMQSTSSSRLVLEEALISMARSDLGFSPEALAVRLEELEEEFEKWIRRGGGEAGAEEPRRPPRRVKQAAGKRAAETGVEPTAGQVPEAPREEFVEEEGIEKKIAAPVDLATVRRSWLRIRERVKEKKITTHAFLLEGKPSEVRGGELVVSFPPERDFHRGELEKEDHRKVLEEAVEEVLGVRLGVRSRTEEIRASGKEERPEKPARPRGEAAAADERGMGGDAGEEAKVTDKEAVREAAPKAAGKTTKGGPELHDAGKVKLVKDVFGAEMIEEIKLNE